MCVCVCMCVYTVFPQSWSAIEQPLKEAASDGRFVVMGTLPMVKRSSLTFSSLVHSLNNITHSL